MLLPSSSLYKSRPRHSVHSRQTCRQSPASSSAANFSFNSAAEAGREAAANDVSAVGDDGERGGGGGVTDISGGTRANGGYCIVAEAVGDVTPPAPPWSEDSPSLHTVGVGSPSSSMTSSEEITAVSTAVAVSAVSAGDVVPGRGGGDGE